MARRFLQALEGDLKNKPLIRVGAHAAHGAKALGGVIAHVLVEFLEFGVREARIGLADGDQDGAPFGFVPNAERVVRIEGRALAVPTLGVHHHRVHQEGIALPFEPRSARTAGHVVRIPALEHQPFDHRVGRIVAQGLGVVPALVLHERRHVEACGVEALNETFQALAPLGERQGAQVLVAIGENVVGANEGGMGAAHLIRHAFPIEALLEIGERSDLDRVAPPRLVHAEPSD